MVDVSAPRHWGLFWTAAAMALHAAVVGGLLQSLFFLMAFFWGWVAVAALKDKLEAAQAMAIVMIILLLAVAGLSLQKGAGGPADVAYYTFALYPALVSWVCVLFYIRFLIGRDQAASPPGAAGRQQPKSARKAQSAAATGSSEPSASPVRQARSNS
jgi:hypothetical protein